MQITYASESYAPSRDHSDDGGITVLLDGIAVLAGAMLAYVALVMLAYVVLKRLGTFSRPASRRST